MKRKLFSVVLVLVLTLSMSVAVFGMDHDDPYSYAITPATTVNH